MPFEKGEIEAVSAPWDCREGSNWEQSWLNEGLGGAELGGTSAELNWDLGTGRWKQRWGWCRLQCVVCVGGSWHGLSERCWTLLPDVGRASLVLWQQRAAPASSKPAAGPSWSY